MTVTPLIHDRGLKPCRKVAQYASASWLAQFTEQGTQCQCLGCDRIVTPRDLTEGEPIDETDIA